MEKADFLDQLITIYSYDEVETVHELCLFYYTSQTGHVLTDTSKAALKDMIYQRPSLAQIRDTIYTLMEMYQNKGN